jgi:hypothetical protein
MNGWFMHDMTCWPPAPAINPIFVSFHAHDERLISNNVEYFKKHEPIGCRDEETAYWFKKNGIDAYFTGCLTMIFDEDESIEYEERVKWYAVDTDRCHVSFRRDHAQILTDDRIEVINHSEVIPANKRHNIYERLQIARELLDKYSRCQTLITSRIHAALPTIAMGRPVLHNDPKYLADHRYTGLYSLLGNDVKSPVKDKFIADLKRFWKTYDIVNRKPGMVITVPETPPQGLTNSCGFGPEQELIDKGIAKEEEFLVETPVIDVFGVNSQTTRMF